VRPPDQRRHDHRQRSGEPRSHRQPRLLRLLAVLLGEHGLGGDPRAAPLREIRRRLDAAAGGLPPRPRVRGRASGNLPGERAPVRLRPPELRQPAPSGHQIAPAGLLSQRSAPSSRQAGRAVRREMPTRPATLPRMWPRTRPVALAAASALLAAAALGGCGGGGDNTLTKAEFVSKGDQICTDAHNQFAALQKNPPSTAAEAAVLTQKLIDISSSELDQIRGLAAPADVQPALDRYLKARE